MAKSFENTNSKKLLELIVLLSILLLFVGTALAVVMVGASSYKLIGNDMKSNFGVRTPIAYIATKVRQNDRLDAIHVENLEGTSALVLEETIEGISYETWIYADQGQMREIYIEKGTPIGLADGMEILEVGGLEVVLDTEGLLQIQVEDLEGRSQEINMSIRSQEGRKE